MNMPRVNTYERIDFSDAIIQAFYSSEYSASFVKEVALIKEDTHT